MQVEDTNRQLETYAAALAAAQQLPEKPYAYAGLSVQGVSPARLTKYPNSLIEVPDEVGAAIALRVVAKRFTESRIAIAQVGLGVQPAALTVRAHVRVMTISAGLARVAANLQSRDTPTPKRAPPSDADQLEIEF